MGCGEWFIEVVGGVGVIYVGNIELVVSLGVVCGLYDFLSDGNVMGDDGMIGDRW